MMSDRTSLLPLRIYIAGPYRADTSSEVDANINRARDAMAALLRMGHTPFCPHAHTARFERDYPDIADEVYLEQDLRWLHHCDAVLRLPGWETSAGTRAELDAAYDMGMMIYTSIDEVPTIERASNGERRRRAGRATGPSNGER